MPLDKVICLYYLLFLLHYFMLFTGILNILYNGHNFLFFNSTITRPLPPIKSFVHLKNGLNNVALDNNTTIRINIVGSNSFNFYNVMRIIQTFLGSLIILLGGYTYIQLRNEKLLNRVNGFPLIVLLLFGSMAVYNGLTSTCSMSILLQDYLN